MLITSILVICASVAVFNPRSSNVTLPSFIDSAFRSNCTADAASVGGSLSVSSDKPGNNRLPSSRRTKPSFGFVRVIFSTATRLPASASGAYCADTPAIFSSSIAKMRLFSMLSSISTPLREASSVRLIISVIWTRPLVFATPLMSSIPGSFCLTSAANWCRC